ncbi:efflux transporter outer membrane subunit [Pseudomonas sp. 2FG]|uniref:efflux transporter outer membrane subunit n=1 Tax=Pseudomonas sp. 2FG TaxID=2502191 RepID=UPI0010F5DFE2|nr:efflux transporter outer membrane subunit [Pseudomonas sp. 2FG]
MKPSLLRLLGLAIATLALGACAIGPDYQRPDSAESVQFKQAAGWKAAAPADSVLRGNWWALYGDAELDQLVERLNANNQSLASASAQYRQARALARGARAAFFPSLALNSGLTRAGQGGGDSTIGTTGGVSVSGANAAQVSKSYEAGLGVSWEVDIWGKLRRQLEADSANLQASAADLAAVRLSQQAELVQSYLQLRVLDQQQRLLDETVAAYQQALRIAENQYRAGIVPKSDVTQALTQLKSTEAEALDLQQPRALLEHALAVLVGVAPAQFELAVREQVPQLPTVPLSLPSSLLERRPDIAAAERRVIAANAKIGVAQAAYYPDLALSASGGYRSGGLDDWISLPNRFWSIGPQFALNLFDGGLIRSQVEQAEASYDQTVAGYRLSVLEGLREVEDYLVQLAVLEREALVQQQGLEAARESLRLILSQYQAGSVEFTDVVSVQASALSNERTRLTLQGNRLTTSVLLIAALGGGWDGVSADEATPD